MITLLITAAIAATPAECMAEAAVVYPDGVIRWDLATYTDPENPQVEDNILTTESLPEAVVWFFGQLQGGQHLWVEQSWTAEDQLLHAIGCAADDAPVWAAVVSGLQAACLALGDCS